MKTLKRIAILIRILFKKKPDGNDYLNLWLIPFFNVTIHEEHAKYGKDDRSFFIDHQVKDWQFRAWYKIAFFKVRRTDSYWWNARYFKIFGKNRFVYYPSRWLQSKEQTKKDMSWLSLQLSPSTFSKKY